MNAQKLQEAREKMGGKFPWQRKEWRYNANGHIRETFERARRESDDPRENGWVDDRGRP